jgi:hypothetical protein
MKVKVDLLFVFCLIFLESYSNSFAFAGFTPNPDTQSSGKSQKSNKIAKSKKKRSLSIAEIILPVEDGSKEKTVKPEDFVTNNIKKAFQKLVQMNAQIDLVRRYETELSRVPELAGLVKRPFKRNRPEPSISPESSPELDLSLQSEMTLPELTDLEMRITRDAYELVLNQTIAQVAAELQVPIAYRKPTLASRSFQFIGFSTKPQAVKNKSSTMLGINGYIPCNGFAGKKGDHLKNLWFSHCQTDSEGNCKISLSQCLERAPTVMTFHDYCGKGIQEQIDSFEFEEFQKEFFSRLEQIEHENKMIEIHLRPLAGENEPKYQCIPVISIDSLKKQVVIQSDPWASQTSWIDYSEEMESEQFALVLADDRGIPMTADTDLLIVGQEKTAAEVKKKIQFRSDIGYHLPNTPLVIKKINQYWSEKTENALPIIQHADEVLFGLNPIDDEIVAIDRNGKIDEFDLRMSEGSYSIQRRRFELKRFSKWLASQIEYSDLYLLNERQLEQRQNMGRTNFLELPNTDYQHIREMILSNEQVCKTPDL